MSCVVAVDAMGGDDAPAAVVEGAWLAHEEGVPVVLVGDEVALRQHLAGRDLPVVHAPDVLAMDASAAEVKRTEQASIRRAMGLVREGRAGSVVSCGGSGATLVAAVIDLGLLEGVERPAIAVALPRADGGTLYLLDAGASVDCRADHLASFAWLGSAWARAMGVADPGVGLLSNGTEVHKGNRLVREAHALLSALPMRYLGQVEPHVALMRDVDVLVADGFAGNVLLKTAEGVIVLLRELFRGEFANTPERLAGLSDVTTALRQRLDWRLRGGGLLVGTTAPVVIAHGRADASAVRAAVRLAHYACTGGLVDDVRQRLRAAAAPGPGDKG
jgi:glycerol-3-phosphate acyltransferase PlsX